MTSQIVSGIAAQAANGRLLGSKQRVEYRSLPSKSILNRCSNPEMPFRWTVNPYRGCEIGCHYCYAVYTHGYLGLDDPGQFDSLVFSKENAKQLLSRELAKGVSGAIAVGTGTDPYQPAERRFETTRGILEAFAEFSGNVIGITTKSDLILRDIDLLGRIALGNQLHVNVTVTTMDDELARALEPRAARPDKRIDAVRELRWRGIEAGVFSAPVLPLLTDSSALLEDVARAAKRADASHWHAHPLFLRHDARKRMVAFLDERFPHLTDRYRAHYGNGAYVSEAYREWLAAKVGRIQQKFGLSGRADEVLRKPVASELATPPLQGELFEGIAA